MKAKNGNRGDERKGDKTKRGGETRKGDEKRYERG